MLQKRRWIAVGMAVMAVAMAAGGALVVGGARAVSAAQADLSDMQSPSDSGSDWALLSRGGGHGGGFDDSSIDDSQLLADALGITTDELDAAYAEARTAAINQALEEGVITQEQADEMLASDDTGSHGRGLRGALGFRIRGLSSDAIDEKALLAEALGITVDELQAARDAAEQAGIDQAIAEGLITQEEADAMQAREAVKSYLDRDALVAAALGMTVDELRAAYDEGETRSTLMAAEGMDQAAFEEALQQATADALAQAVKDGVITQEQADALQAEGATMPGPSGHRGRGGHGGSRGDRGVAPESLPEGAPFDSDTAVPYEGSTGTDA